MDRDSSRPGAMRVQRVVAMVPSATEVLVMLGAADRVVARTDYDDGREVAHAQSFGRSMLPSAEAVLALHPDLYIDATYSHMRGSEGDFARHGIRTLTTNLQDLDDIYALIDTLGAVLQLPERADSLRRALEARANALRNDPITERPTILYVVWHDPPRTAGPGTYLSEIIELAGARNVFDDARSEWPEFSMEMAVQRDPAFVVVPVEPDLAFERLRALPGWRELRAIREGRVIEVSQTLFGRPGPRALQAAATLRSELRARTAQ